MSTQDSYVMECPICPGRGETFEITYPDASREEAISAMADHLTKTHSPFQMLLAMFRMR